MLTVFPMNNAPLTSILKDKPLVTPVIPQPVHNKTVSNSLILSNNSISNILILLFKL